LRPKTRTDCLLCTDRTAICYLAARTATLTSTPTVSLISGHGIVVYVALSMDSPLKQSRVTRIPGLVLRRCLLLSISSCLVSNLKDFVFSSGFLKFLIWFIEWPVFGLCSGGIRGRNDASASGLCCGGWLVVWDFINLSLILFYVNIIWINQNALEW